MFLFSLSVGSIFKVDTNFVVTAISRFSQQFDNGTIKKKYSMRYKRLNKFG